MDLYHIIKRPLITEKGTHLSQQHHDATHTMKARGGSYCFEVNATATKPLIKQAIEKIYNVRVLSVRTQVRQGKSHRSRMRMVSRPDWKKAIVVLHADSHIDLF